MDDESSNKEVILDWYLDTRIFDSDPFTSDRDTSLIYYENLVTNYVAHHSHMFTGRKPQHLWYNLELHDWRLDKIESKREKPNPESREEEDTAKSGSRPD